ncbi:MAG: hypothetical protein STSR0008_20110 [Ignavibacterium sp.]
MLNKSFLFLFVIIFFTEIVNAQEEQTNYNYNPNTLVYSRGLPGELLLFSPDSAVQILFNPARAMNFNTNFVYSSYISDFNQGINTIINNYYYYDRYPPIFYFNEASTSIVPNFPDLYTETYTNKKNPTFSINSLFGSDEKKWLISFANGVNTLESKINNKFLNSTYHLYDISYYSFNTQNTNTKENNDNYITKFSVLNIRKTNLGNVFFGISGLINNQNNKNVTNYLDYFQSINTYQNNSNENINDSKIEEDNNLYQGGLNFGLNTPKLDYVGKLYYVYNENKIIYEQNYRNSQIDSTYYPQHLNIFNRTQFYKNNFNSKSKGIIFNNYFQSEINNSFFKNYFVTLDAYYLNNKLNFDGTYNYSYESFIDTSSSVNNFSSLSNPKSLDKNDWGFRISTGLTFKKKIDNLYILSAFILDGSHNDFHYLSQDNNVFIPFPNYTNVMNYYFSNEKNNVFTLTLPIYLNLDLFQFLSVYGGFNFAYQYIDRKITKEYDLNYYSSGTNPIQENYQNYFKKEDDNFKSYKSVYVGLEFKHKSGLVMQISFDEDISTFQDWNFSLGYHF